ncbi:MAG: orotate phosphoribosyltransferase, partial [Chthonomonas sp.]|nr:orotate phosphoribosyltransferase [Chthonomonas sp.]
MNPSLPQLLESSGAILRGHFVLTSGRHSDVYFEKFRILEQPAVLSALCAQIAEAFRNQKIDVVCGPTTGGVIVAFEVARQMHLPALYVETENGAKALRRQASVAQGARVLVVDDVFTTGRSVIEVAELIRAKGATVAGTGVLIDRSESPVDLGCPLFAA